MIKNSNKQRLCELAGILNEKIQLNSSLQGRSDLNTLGYYIEEYIIKTGTDLLNKLEQLLISQGHRLVINPGTTTISENSLVIKFIIDQNKEFLLTIMVILQQECNTSASITINGATDKFNLNSHHNANDINLFMSEIINRISASLKAKTDI